MEKGSPSYSFSLTMLFPSKDNSDLVALRGMSTIATLELLLFVSSHPLLLKAVVLERTWTHSLSSFNDTAELSASAGCGEAPTKAAHAAQ